uniref:NADH-ubiquinone oxidoreductase chain 4 n=1 Tax=Tabachnickia sp. DVL-2014 TaxID=1569960 RepID=A0A0N7AFT5_9METZ|nr:NADH dehydrogenase subunit 4 [Tabachnickia sp. DVL-2014]
MNTWKELLISTTIISITLYLCPSNSKKQLFLTSSVSSIIILIQATYLFNQISWEYDILFIIKSNNTITTDKFPFLSIKIDKLSTTLILLTSILIPPCLLISKNSIYQPYKNFLICLFTTELFLISAFSTSNLILFYILFESSIIPISIIIGTWGLHTEKIQATYYFFLYTISGSVPLLLSILYIYKNYHNFDIQNIKNPITQKSIETTLFAGFFLAFAVKTPLIPFHSWLPLAHVEAPAIGSVILAGILLKLGSYGFLRFTLTLLPNTSTFLSPIIITLSILSIWYASLNSLRQNDLKRIIAYSSIAHMGLITIAIFSGNATSKSGAINLMIAHGLTSSTLFILISCIYERHKTRKLIYYQGLTTTSPIYSTSLLLTSLAHMDIPGSLNFIGEYKCLLGLLETNIIITILTIPGIILTTCYLLLLYVRLTCSNPSTHIKKNRDLNRRETIAITSLILPILITGIFPTLLEKWYNLNKMKDCDSYSES